MDFQSEAKQYMKSTPVVSGGHQSLAYGGGASSNYQGGSSSGFNYDLIDDKIDYNNDFKFSYQPSVYNGQGKMVNAVSTKFNISKEAAAAFIILVVFIIVLFIFKNLDYIKAKLGGEKYTAIETPNGIISEELRIGSDGTVQQVFGYGDSKTTKTPSISGIPDSGNSIENTLNNPPYPDIIQDPVYSPENYRRVPKRHRKERYTNPDGYRIQGNRAYFEDPLTLLASSMTEGPEMAGIQSVQNNIMMKQAKNIGNTEQTQELDTMKQLQMSMPMAFQDVRLTEEANKYQQKLENTQNFYNQSVTGQMQLAPNQDLTIYTATNEIPTIDTTINSGQPTEPAYGVVPASISPEFETQDGLQSQASAVVLQSQDPTVGAAGKTEQYRRYRQRNIRRK